MEGFESAGPIGYVGASTAMDGQGIDQRRMSVRGQLSLKLARLKEEQKNIEDTIASLDAIPGVEKLLDQLRKVGI